MILPVYNFNCAKFTAKFSEQHLHISGKNRQHSTLSCAKPEYMITYDKQKSAFQNPNAD